MVKIDDCIVLSFRPCIYSEYIIVATGYGDLWLNGSNNILEFQLSDGTWGTVCIRGFDDDAADTACKQLGYQSESKYDEE